MLKDIPIFEAKNKLPLFIHIAETDGPITITRRNKDVAVLISKSDYDNLLNCAKNNRKSIPFLKRVEAFRERNKDFYSDSKIDEIFLREDSNFYNRFENSDNCWNGCLE